LTRWKGVNGGRAREREYVEERDNIVGKESREFNRRGAG
jgi:hypothetical protein